MHWWHVSWLGSRLPPDQSQFCSVEVMVLPHSGNTTVELARARLDCQYLKHILCYNLSQFIDLPDRRDSEGAQKTSNIQERLGQI